MPGLRELWRRREAQGDGPQASERSGETCLSCGADLRESRSYQAYRVCHSCGFHFHLTAKERMALLLDAGTFRETDRGVTAIDPLAFPDRHTYRVRVINAQRRTGLAEAALTGTGQMFGRDVVVAALDYSFLGGSIGVVAGERLARAFEKAANRRLPIVSVASTSGTRMQEGVLALMQLPRVMAAVNRHAALGLPHIAIMTDPATGSAYAGFVNHADYVLAEPNALVGYAALRVLQEQDDERTLPPGAHTAESHFARGLVDAVVPRHQLREQVGLLLDLLISDYRLSAPRERGAAGEHHTHRPAGQQLELSRHANRPGASDFIGRMTAGFMPIRGDRTGRDDEGVVAGFASLAGEAIVVIGQERHRGDGWLRPAGFRKAVRAMRLAAKFGLPVLTLIDTRGAHPGFESEEEGLGHAIAACLSTMLEVRVPTLAVITGEGSSEAAAAMAAADAVLMLDNAVYEVIRPEEAARVLFSEAGRASEAAERLRITSHDCLRLGIIDRTVPEPADGAHTNHEEAALLLRRAIMRELTRLQAMREKARLDARYRRYRGIGDTRSWLRGTVERRLAHLSDRAWGLWDRVRGTPSELRRRDGSHGEVTDIPF
jgi:acetyl-CoA carboxylase carboxyl transferase subunit beta